MTKLRSATFQTISPEVAARCQRAMADGVQDFAMTFDVVSGSQTIVGRVQKVEVGQGPQSEPRWTVYMEAVDPPDDGRSLYGVIMRGDSMDVSPKLTQEMVDAMYRAHVAASVPGASDWSIYSAMWEAGLAATKNQKP